MCYILDIAKYWVEIIAHMLMISCSFLEIVNLFVLSLTREKIHIFQIFEYAKLIDKSYVRELRRQVCELVDRTIQ